MSIFDWKLKKNCCHFRNQHPQIFQYAKFHAKIKTTYIYDKKCSIWRFSGWNSKKPLSYLKLTPSNLFHCKVWCKIKILKLGERKYLICVFLGYSLKILLSYLKFSNLSCWTGIFKKLL